MKARIMIISLLMIIATGAMAQQKQTRKTKPATTQTTDTLDIKKLTEKAKAGNADAQNSLGICYYNGRKVKQNYEAALKWWSMAAKQKHAKATANMGLCYQYGKAIEKDSLKAVKLYMQSVKLGNKELLSEREKRVSEKFNMFDARFLAEVYAEGIGVSKDIKKAQKYYVMAANAGSLDASKEAAKIYEKEKEYIEACKLYAKVAGKDVESAAKYGEFLYKGIGTAVNKKEAAKYLGIAAKNGITNSQIMLGDLYYTGDGLNKNIEEAIKWYKTASLKGSPVSYWNLGVIYADSASGVTDYYRSTYWFAQTAKMGMKNAYQKKLQAKNTPIDKGWKDTDYYTFVKGLTLLYGTNNNIDEAVKCFESLQKKNIPVATTMLAFCYADTSWKKAKSKKYMKYLVEAADANEPVACYHLAKEYLEGKNISVDEKKARTYLEKSVNARNPEAMCYLGDMYYNGKLVSKDLTQAIKLYIGAMSEGYITKNAAEILAKCYEQGLGGVKKSEDMAKRVRARASDKMPAAVIANDLTLE